MPRNVSGIFVLSRDDRTLTNQGANVSYDVNSVFGVTSQGSSKGEILVVVVRHFLLICAMFLTGCATDRQSVTSPPSATSNLAQQPGQYGDGISYWDDKGSAGKPRIVI